jgi:hypothetical protein
MEAAVQAGDERRAKHRWDPLKRERVRRERLWKGMCVAEEVQDLVFQGGSRAPWHSHRKLMQDADAFELMEAASDLAAGRRIWTGSFTATYHWRVLDFGPSIAAPSS